MTVPAFVDAFIPFHGPCGLCGHGDARHRVLDAMVGMVRGGDSPESVADDYGVPVEFVILLSDQWWGEETDLA